MELTGKVGFDNKAQLVPSPEEVARREAAKGAWEKQMKQSGHVVEPLTNLPQRLDDLDRGQADKLVAALRANKAGFEVSPELPPPPSVTTDAQVGTDEQPDTLAQIEKLGQLHEAGVLTDEEFQTKKAALLGRL